MPPQSTVARLGVVAIAAASLALVIYLGVEAFNEPEAAPPSSAPQAARPQPASEPLPETAGTMAGLWELAWREARAWRDDARLTRMYASAIHPDGTFDRARADVQFVFLSKGLTASGSAVGGANGLRWALSQGRTHTMELRQYPAPSLEAAAPSLCELGALAGQGPPAEVVIDAFYVEHDGKPPVLSMFTEDRKFMVLADPMTCEVKGKATRQTAQELDGGEEVVVDAGRQFDTAGASRLVEGVLAGAASCKKPEGPTGPGTVSVRFERGGKVDEVSFQVGGYGGTAVGACLEQRLRAVVVKPWDSGRGFIIKRFTL